MGNILKFVISLLHLISVMYILDAQQIIYNTNLCPQDQLFDNESMRCYDANSKGPCGELMLFLPESQSKKPNLGYCDCDSTDLDNNNCTYRPKIYWSPENRCYYAYEQGPCLQGEWLVVEKTNFYYNAFCIQNSCPLNQKINNCTAAGAVEDKFWFPFGGSCYQTGTQGFCRDQMLKVYIMRNELTPLCLPDSTCHNITNTNTEEITEGVCNGSRMPKRYI